MPLRFDPFRGSPCRQRGLAHHPPDPVVPMDAVRRDDEVIVAFDLPGVDPELIDRSRPATRPPSPPSAAPDAARATRCSPPSAATTFSRQLFLGDTLDAARVGATYDAGVLTLTVPVAELSPSPARSPCPPAVDRPPSTRPPPTRPPPSSPPADNPLLHPSPPPGACCGDSRRWGPAVPPPAGPRRVRPDERARRSWAMMGPRHTPTREGPSHGRQRGPS